MRDKTWKTTAKGGEEESPAKKNIRDKGSPNHPRLRTEIRIFLTHVLQKRSPGLLRISAERGEEEAFWKKRSNGRNSDRRKRGDERARKMPGNKILYRGIRNDPSRIANSHSSAFALHPKNLKNRGGKHYLNDSPAGSIQSY